MKEHAIILHTPLFLKRYRPGDSPTIHRILQQTVGKFTGDEEQLMKHPRLDIWSLPLVLLLGGFLTDLLHHLADGESLNDFLFGMEGIFSLQHILLPIGVAVLLTLVILESLAPRKARPNPRDAS